MNINFYNRVPSGAKHAATFGLGALPSIQHSDDTKMSLLDGYRTDDMLKITGFKLRSNGKFRD
jgi:hypothetical protein